MTLAEVKTKYITLCGDVHVTTHYRRFMDRSLSLQKLVDWLLLRGEQDGTLLRNIDGTIHEEPIDFTWDYFTLIK